MFGKNEITKKQEDFTGTIDIVEIFQTIQGEGLFSGRPCVFIRFQGCCLRCKFCDTDFDRGVTMSLHDILDEVACLMPPECKQPLVVVTGGEPFLAPGIVNLTEKLISIGTHVQIETSGVHWQKGFDKYMKEHYNSTFRTNFSIVCSPKTGKLNAGIVPYISAYKYVILEGQVSEDDGLPNVSPESGKPKILARPPTGFKGPVYVMPCDAHDEEQNKRNLEATIDSCMSHGHTLCLQIHKIIGVD